MELPIITVDGEGPPEFAWNAWYEAVGGRKIAIPEVDTIIREIYEEQAPRFRGEPADEVRPFASPEEAAGTIKELAREFGADIVGICRIEPSDIYTGRTVRGEFAIAIGQRMRYRDFQTVPSHDSAVECVRIYKTLGETVIRLAEAIWEMGYHCEVQHPVGDSDLLHIPIGLKAGFGELGRHGSIIHPELGPLFRMGTIATNLPMAIDHPIDAGIARFCDHCRACRKYCPADAIPDERSPEHGVDHLGNPRYVVDTGRCFAYFAEHKYCSACLPVCVYNHKEWARDFEGFETKKFPEVVLEEPPERADPPGVRMHGFPRRD